MADIQRRANLRNMESKSYLKNVEHVINIGNKPMMCHDHIYFKWFYLVAMWGLDWQKKKMKDNGKILLVIQEYIMVVQKEYSRKKEVEEETKIESHVVVKGRVGEDLTIKG